MVKRSPRLTCHSLEQVRAFLTDELKLPPTRQVIVPAVQSAELEKPDVLAACIQNGSIKWSWVNNFTGRWYQTFTTTRGAVGLSHLRAHHVFLESPFSIGVVFEDDATLSTRWRYKGEHVFTSRIVYNSLAHAVDVLHIYAITYNAITGSIAST